MNYLSSTIIAVTSIVFVACSGTPTQKDLIEAIDSGNIEEVRDVVSDNGTYSVMDRVINGKNILQYAQSKGGIAMAEVVASTKFTDVDKNKFIAKYVNTCMKLADKEYCVCSGEKIYSEITYLDLMDSTSHMREVMQSAQQECK